MVLFKRVSHGEEREANLPALRLFRRLGWNPIHPELCVSWPNCNTGFRSPSAIPTTMPRRRRARSQARAKSLAPVPSAAGTLQTRPPWLPRQGRWTWVLIALGGIVLLTTLSLVGIWVAHSPGRLQDRAEAAARAGDWAAALTYWRSFNATGLATGATHLSEARAALALGRAAQAEQSLRQATVANPSDLTPWRLLLKILRVEDRVLESEQLGWTAYTKVRSEDRAELLRELTLSLLADLPDEVVRTTLRRWVEADSADIDAQIALWRRIAASPRATDPDRPRLVAALESLLSNHPDHVGAREALVAALADAGDPERGRVLLDTWPEASRDGRYWRLRGRWDLDYDRQPERAVNAFHTALKVFPQDWRSWYRLARALRMLGRDDEGHRAAATVGRIRETLDPLTLGPRLDTAVNHLDDPASLKDLAILCEHAGLKRLADAWRALIPDTAAHRAFPLQKQKTTMETPQRDG